MAHGDETGQDLAADSDPEQPRIDGRTARRDRNRNIVIDAFLDLMSDGIAEPTHEMVASRSGVSLRSVFRYWDDTDQMYAAVFDRARIRVDEMVPLFEPNEGSFEDRCEEFVENRIARMLAAGNWGRVVRLREPIAGMPSEMLEEVRVRVLANIRDQFRPELAAMDPADAELACVIIFQTCSYEGMDQLRRQLDLDADEIKAAGMRTITALLT